MKTLMIFISLFISILLPSGCEKSSEFKILVSDDATPVEMLAAKEVRRYIYLRTDEWLPIITTAQPAGRKSIVVATRDSKILTLFESLSADDYDNLGDQDFMLKSVIEDGSEIHFVVGGGARGVLYAAYQLAEELGVRFNLHGDVIPDEKIMLKLPEFDVKSKPLFELRGILPFHDFPEGPDWWSLQEYKAIIGQLPRLKMNFIGFHNYPENRIYPSGSYQAEPFVWIGLPEDVMENGTVKSGYPVLHFNTQDDTWGYHPMKTSDYHGGAAQLFEADYFGAEYMLNTGSWPRTEEQNMKIFNDFGSLLNNAFSFAGKLGIRTCTGTETPLIIPEELKGRLDLQNKLFNPEIEKEIYKGIFSRISLAYPLDYYWLWTPEGWTWSGTTEEQVRATEDDLLTALSALEEIKAPFTLATCGWVLGPPGDRARFDRLLPKNIPFSCINREVGFSPVEPAFGEVRGRPTWAIPWMEDDPALVSPQLWAGRMRKDAADALKFGCTGLMGIHWRTRILGPNVASLAGAAWSHVNWNKPLPGEGQRDMPVDDFYKDWCRSQFGTDVPEEVIGIFTRLDGGPLYDPAKKEGRTANLFRTSDWKQGPGGIKILKESWSKIESEFGFVDSLAGYRNMIKGKGNVERYDYWLNTFKFARATAKLGCDLGKLDSLLILLQSEKDDELSKELAESPVLSQRIEAARKFDEMIYYLLQTVNTTGELGTIANLEQHNLGHLQILSRYDSIIAGKLGKPLPPEAFPSMEYKGLADYGAPLRIIVPAVRNLLEPDEDLNLKVMVLSDAQVKNICFYWRAMGTGKYKEIPVNHIARSVYRVNLPSSSIQKQDFEFYFEVTAEDGDRYFYPCTAPDITQTVVVMPY